MIKKFIKIKNVGRFSNFSVQGDISFNRVNIIYGENSAGKTTLTSIIRSLLKNEPSLILERRTYGENEDPYTEILCEENQKKYNYKFQDNKWNDNLGSVEIFDVFFVDENVYTGLEISSEHQKGLYQFALGEEGVALAKEIKEFKDDLQTDYGKLSGLKEQIEVAAEKYFRVEEFVAIEKDENIAPKIEAKKKEINIAEAKQEIKKKDLLTEISAFGLPINLQTLKSLLERSVKNISAEFLEKVEKHKEKLRLVLGKEAEPWLQRGLSYVETTKDSKCPFCQKDLKGAESTIIAYQQYFNEEYKKLKEEIDKYSREIDKISIEEMLNQMNRTILQNNTLVEFWKNYLPSRKSLEVNADNLCENIKEEFNKIKQLVKEKSKTILEPVNTGDVDTFINFKQGLNSKIEAYNSQVKKWNTEINELKNKQKDLNKLIQELKKLEIQDKRFSPEVEKICKDYKGTLQEIKSKKKLLEDKEKQLKQAVSQKIKKYGEEINKCLEKFGVSFQIKEARPTYRGKSKEPYLEYGIAFNEYEVDLYQQTKHSLGEGDKNAIALAFFLAKLSLDEKIGDKVVIFDDPVSSLDRNRRTRTVECIRDLSEKAKQIIVLTHYDIFAFDLYNYMRKIKVKPKTLQICDGKIKEWGIEEEMKHPYFKRISTLEKFLDRDEKISPTDATKKIRLVLEDALRFRYFKYFEELGDDCWLGSMVDRLRKEVKENSNFKFKHDNNEEVLQELGNLCDFSGPSHHGNISLPHKEEKSPGEIKGYVKTCLKMIYEWL